MSSVQIASDWRSAWQRSKVSGLFLSAWTHHLSLVRCYSDPKIL